MVPAAQIRSAPSESDCRIFAGATEEGAFLPGVSPLITRISGALVFDSLYSIADSSARLVRASLPSRLVSHLDGCTDHETPCIRTNDLKTDSRHLSTTTYSTREFYKSTIR